MLTEILHDEIDAIEELEAEVSRAVDAMLRDKLAGALAVAVSSGNPVASAIEVLLEDYAQEVGRITSRAFDAGVRFGQVRDGR